MVEERVNDTRKPQLFTFQQKQRTPPSAPRAPVPTSLETRNADTHGTLVVSTGLAPVTDQLSPSNNLANGEEANDLSAENGKGGTLLGGGSADGLVRGAGGSNEVALLDEAEDGRLEGSKVTAVCVNTSSVHDIARTRNAEDAGHQKLQMSRRREKGR